MHRAGRGHQHAECRSASDHQLRVGVETRPRVGQCCGDVSRSARGDDRAAANDGQAGGQFVAVAVRLNSDSVLVQVKQCPGDPQDRLA